jgi:serine/threonine protein kinase
MFTEYEIPMRVSPIEGDSIGSYKIISLLGEGTFGSVYKVAAQDGKIRALKLLRLYDLYPVTERKNVARRFDLEFNTGKIISPNLVESFTKGVEKGNPYFTMYYCSNGALDKKIGSKIDEAYAKKIAVDILNGMKALHDNGKIHRDLKPQNILIDEKNNARLTDFGIAGHLNLGKGEVNEREVRLTTTDIFGKPKERFGSYPYMPPEQLNPPNKVVTKIPANDIFSFGVLVFELLTGQLPFGKITGEADLADYIYRVKKGQWKTLNLFRSDLSPVWQEVMEGCLQPDYKKRFSNVNHILDLFGRGVSFVPPISITNGISLVIMQGEEHNRVYDIGEKLRDRNSGIISIGRMDDGVNNIVSIKDDELCYISRNHATIEKQGENKWIIRDGQWVNNTGKSSWKRSTNGTYLNGVEVDNLGQELQVNDIITIGDTTLKVIDEGMSQQRNILFAT